MIVVKAVDDALLTKRITVVEEQFWGNVQNTLRTRPSEAYQGGNNRRTSHGNRYCTSTERRGGREDITSCSEVGIYTDQIMILDARKFYCLLLETSIGTGPGDGPSGRQPLLRIQL